MRWSNVVKRHLRKNKEVKQYRFEEVAFTKASGAQPHPEEERSTESAGGPLEPEVEAQAPVSFYEQEYAKGKAAGYEQGVAKGYEQGVARGEAAGYEQGVAKGEAAGVEQGYAKGFAEGESSGKEIRAEELCEYENTHQLLLRLIDDLKDFTETIVTETENDVLQIAIDIAQKILQKEMATNPEVILAWAQDALKKIGPMESALIRVHPQDIEMLTRKRPELLAAVEGMGLLKFEPDLKLLPGDCIVEGPDRMVDARPSSQLEIIKQGLLPPSEEGK